MVWRLRRTRNAGLRPRLLRRGPVPGAGTL